MSGSDKVQFLSAWPSIYSMRVQLALTAKGIPFTDVPQDLANKSSLLLQSNPVYKQIPVLLHNDRAVCESPIIVEYIDEVFPSPDGRDLLPKDPYEKASVRFWADFVDKKILGSLLGVMRKSGKDRDATLEEARGAINVLEEAFPKLGKESPYFGGANVGFLDIIVGPMTVWIPTFGTLTGEQLFDKSPRLNAWMKAFQQSSAAKCLPQTEKLVEFVRARYSIQ